MSSVPHAGAERTPLGKHVIVELLVEVTDQGVGVGAPDAMEGPSGEERRMDHETSEGPAMERNDVGGGACTVDGKVDGNIFVGDGDTLTVNGEVNGNIEAKGSGDVILGAGAVVRGDIKHKGAGTVDFIADGVGSSRVNGGGFRSRLIEGMKLSGSPWCLGAELSGKLA